MKTHPIRVDGYEGALEELAQAVFRMRYDKVAQFLFHAQQELKRQSQGDAERGRMQLSGLLADAERKMGESQKVMENVYALCRPFMKDEFPA